MRRARSRSARGAALILVVVVIAALLAIAAPFVFSMRLHERSARGFSAEVQAEQQADAARAGAIAGLMRTHPDEERRAREARGQLDQDDESGDSLDEVRAAEDPLQAAGLRPFSAADPKGAMAWAEVWDTRGRIDLNASGPDPLANLLGVTVTTAEVSWAEEDELPVEDTSDFFSDGDPATIDGFVKVGSEFIAYRHTEPTRFLGLVRGFFFSRSPPPEDPESKKRWIPEASLVQDGRGWKVSADPLWRNFGTARQGELARFDSTAAIRRIADWEYGTLRAALVLWRYGVTMDRLRQWGVGQDPLQQAGLDPRDFDRDVNDEKLSPAEREQVREAERQLKEWGLTLALVRRGGGDRAVLRVWQHLQGLDSAQRDKTVAVWRKRADQEAAQLAKLESWLKDEVKRQLKGLTEMRDDSPAIETIGRIELEEKVRPFVTTDAPPEGESWCDVQVINHPVRYDPFDWAARLQVQDARRFQPGMIVRIRPRDGRPPEYRTLMDVNGRRSGKDVLVLFPQLDFDYEAGDLDVSCRQPRPINVNTAPREVLRALLVGLQCKVGQKARGRRAPLVVTPAQATAIAAAIEEQPPANHMALRALLLDLRGKDQIDDHAVEAVIRNAIDPADQLLDRSTSPFTYAAGDVYEVTATGVVNDPAGNELARHRYREVVQVAPPRDLTWHLDSQADFTDRVLVPGPLAPGEQPLSTLHELYLPGRWANHVITRPAWLGPWAAPPWGFASRSHAPGQGDLQPLPSREPGKLTMGAAGGAVGVLSRQDYDAQLEGVDLGGGLPAAQLGLRNLAYDDGATLQVAGPTLVRGWFRLDALPSGGAKAFLFDGGQADSVDRVSLYVQDGALVLEAWDESLDVRETLGNPRSTRVRWQPDPALRAGNWYHVAAAWKGSDRNDLALFVDGRLVGRQLHGSRLSAEIDPWTTSIPVEDGSQFPPAGWLRVGASRAIDPGQTHDRGILGSDRDANARCEVLHYVRQGNVLLVDHTQDLAAFQAQLQGVTVTAVRDLDALPGDPAPTLPFPGSARAPERGSGHRIEIRYTGPAPQRRPGVVQLGAGYRHAAGTQVVPYGYTSRLALAAAPVAGAPAGALTDRIRLGGAALTHPLPTNTPYTVLYRPVPGYNPLPPLGDPYPVIVDAVVTQIPVLWAQPWPDPPAGRASADPNAGPNVIGGFPPRGVVRIGAERVYYEGIQVVPDGAILQNCVRGLLGTTAATHRLFDGVVLESILVGYPASYAGAPDDHYRQRPTLTEPRALVSIPPRTPNPVEWLSVQPAQPNMDPRVDLIQRGVMLLPASDRPQANDPANPPDWRHPLAYLLVQWMTQRGGNLGGNPGSQPITPPPVPAGTAPLPETGVLWKEVLKRTELNGSRAQKGTSRPPAGAGGSNGHPAGALLIPTFIARQQDDRESGPDDIVTVTDDQQLTPLREERVVAWAAQAQPGQPGGGGGGPRPPGGLPGMPGLPGQGGQPGDPGQGWMLAFTEDVSRLLEGSAHARLHKWPTGNLGSTVDLSLGRARPPMGPGDTSRDAPGVLRAKLDDLVTMQLEERVPQGQALRLDLTPTGAGLGPVRGNPDSWRDGSIHLTDDELIAVVDATQAGQGSSNLVLLRGALGSTPRAQSGETVGWRLPWPPVAIAQGGLGGARGEVIGLRGGDEFRDRPDGGGYAAIDRGNGSPWAGVWPYVGKDKGGIRRPVDLQDRGTFSFAFGSNLGPPQQNDLVIDLPFRAHDRYADRTSSLQGVFFQAARELPGAYVTAVEWDETLPDSWCEVKVAVRLDGDPGWDAEPAREAGTPGRLWVFDDPRQKNEIMCRAERVELRVYVTWKPGALYKDAWKRPALVGAVRVKYRQPVRVLRREERVD